MTFDPIKLEIFKNLFSSLAEEMGTTLRRSSYSPNIKERRDFSCALFNASGKMVAQAAHIPVHLGAMPLSVQALLDTFNKNIDPGDTFILNDPFRGGTHLPDITLVTPVHSRSAKKSWKLIGFVASRAHHADVGGMSAGSMPVASEIFQEGLIIPPVKLIQAGILNEGIVDLILANVRTPGERRGDLSAQMAANRTGERRLLELVSRYGLMEISAIMDDLLMYAERMSRRLLASIRSGYYTFSDFLDDDGISSRPVLIKVGVTINGEHALVDFTGSAQQQRGSINAVRAITVSAVFYVFRCLLGPEIPNNAGSLAPIEIITTHGSVVDAQHPAAVSGGNVETSQRIVDVLLGALAQACPEIIPAASQGTMNNVLIGGALRPLEGKKTRGGDNRFTYYETTGGGAGATPRADGASAIHTHMTNTLNTPIEALEYAYPLMVKKYSIRAGSGGNGIFRGGDGIIREIEALVDCQVTLLSDRRTHAPYGLAGGGSGKPGVNRVIRKGTKKHLPSKGTFELKAGDILSIQTPGGGGYGVESL
jgi:N-methylhydantoinase B